MVAAWTPPQLEKLVYAAKTPGSNASGMGPEHLPSRIRRSPTLIILGYRWLGCKDQFKRTRKRVSREIGDIWRHTKVEVGNSYEIDKLLLGHLPRWRCMQKRTARMLSMKSFIMRAVVSLKLTAKAPRNQRLEYIGILVSSWYGLFSGAITSFRECTLALATWAQGGGLYWTVLLELR